MKKTNISLIFALTFVAVLLAQVGCQVRRSSHSGTGLKIKLPWQTMNLENSGKLSYSFQNIEVRTLQNPLRVSGERVKFMVAPSLRLGQLTGEEPFAHYITLKDNVIVPTDRLSVELFSIYAHMERLTDLDLRLGLRTQKSGPSKIGVSVKFLDRSGERLKNNALYVGELDTLLIVPYDLGNIPISINGGVLAHEHFHSLFYNRVVRMSGESFPDPSAITAHDLDELGDAFGNLEKISFRKKRPTDGESELVNSVILRGLNEGLADLWAWLYTSDSQFLTLSISSENEARRLDTIQGRLTTLSEVREMAASVHHPQALLPLSYRLGTQLARVMREDILRRNQGKLTAIVGISEARKVMTVLDLLPKILSEKSQTKEFFSLHDFLKTYVKINVQEGAEKSSVTTPTPADCEFWASKGVQLCER